MSELDKLLDNWIDNQSKDNLEDIFNYLIDIKDNEIRKDILEQVKNTNRERFIDLVLNEIYDAWNNLCNDESLGNYIIGEHLTSSEVDTNHTIEFEDDRFIILKDSKVIYKSDKYDKLNGRAVLDAVNKYRELTGKPQIDEWFIVDDKNE